MKREFHRWMWTPMVAILLMIGACVTTPYTNRSQLILLSEAEENQLGVAAYKEVLSKADITTGRPHDIVRRVGERIARAADKPSYQWQFTVIDEPQTVNAFALPGGKVAVYTGLFPIAKDEAGLAAVMGHEVAHALARHGAERMSQGMVLQLGAVGLSAAMGGQDPALANAVMSAYGLGAQVGVALPFNRSQESEADRIGMILMAKAGYDPEAALHLWQRMGANERGGRPPEYLSTHPSAETRQEQIRGWLPEARGYLVRDPNLAVADLPAIK
jgi:predicted Zn-dependent protease